MINFRQFAAQFAHPGGIKGIQRGIESTEQLTIQGRHIRQCRLHGLAEEFTRHAGKLLGPQFEHPIVETIEIVVGRPSLVVAPQQFCPAKNIPIHPEPLGVGMPDGGLHAQTLHPHLAHPDREFATAVRHIEPVERHAMHKQGRLALLIPAQPAARARRNDHAAPTLIVEFAPTVAGVNFVPLRFLGFGQRYMVRSGNRGLNPQDPRIVPDDFQQTRDSALGPQWGELQQGIDWQHRPQIHEHRCQPQYHTHASINSGRGLLDFLPTKYSPLNRGYNYCYLFATSASIFTPIPNPWPSSWLLWETIPCLLQRKIIPVKRRLPQIPRR